jgi:hypothetical protein
MPHPRLVTATPPLNRFAPDTAITIMNHNLGGRLPRSSLLGVREGAVLR